MRWRAPSGRTTCWGCSRPLASPRYLQKAEIWVVSSLKDEDVRAMFMTPFESVQAAVDAALAQQGEAAQVLFLTEASITVPRVTRRGLRHSRVS